MSLFPSNADTILTLEDIRNNNDVITDRGINFLFDFKTREFIIKDGKLIGLTGNAGIAFWIEKTIRTEYERATVYKNTGYGFGIEKFIGIALPTEIIKLQFEDNLKKSILQHERIKSLNNFTMIKVADDSSVEVSFEVELNPLTETDEMFGNVEDSGYISLDNIGEIEDFMSVKLITNDSFYFMTNIGEQVYVKI